MALVTLMQVLVSRIRDLLHCQEIVIGIFDFLADFPELRGKEDINDEMAVTYTCNGQTGKGTGMGTRVLGVGNEDEKRSVNCRM